jgi:hypothetical protein
MGCARGGGRGELSFISHSHVRAAGTVNNANFSPKMAMRAELRELLEIALRLSPTPHKTTSAKWDSKHVDPM